MSEQAVRATSLELAGELLGQDFSEPRHLPSREDCGSGTREVQVTRISMIGDVSHVFSHIKKTYRVVWMLMTGGTKPPELSRKSKSNGPLEKPFKQRGKQSVCRKGSQEGLIPTTEKMWTPLTEVAGAK